ncbi:hypothetical protein CBFG_06035 [Clostridiales bacterium 1_7_47FAA]|nr:hypothetical protein CBFG_06035 [Clostridiales bacterium 1_7_47FAA]
MPPHFSTTYMPFPCIGCSIRLKPRFTRLYGKYYHMSKGKSTYESPLSPTF